MENPRSDLLPPLLHTIRELVHEFDNIPSSRRALLHQLTEYLQRRREGPLYLNFICTHNSRRSHIAQIWAQTAAYYYQVPDVTCYSGGTEATAFNPRAVKALRDVGFTIIEKQSGSNPIYEVRFAESAPPLLAFSKTFDDPFNKADKFAAVMTCAHADENCPYIPQASARIALTYDDPKDFDDTPLEAQKYAERVREIGREMFFAFSGEGMGGGSGVPTS